MERIDTALRSGLTYSLEFLPPRDSAATQRLEACLEGFGPSSPDFIAVTYGAGGSDRGGSLDLSSRIQASDRSLALQHLTCIGQSERELECVLGDVLDAGIGNVLALRGDDPRLAEGQSPRSSHLPDAAAFVRYLRERTGLCIGVAGYPEVHPRAANASSDIEALRRKVDEGADFVITQLFFDTASYFRFAQATERAGIWVPIIPGILPLTSAKQLAKLGVMFGVRIPTELTAAFDRVQDDPEAMAAEGVSWAARQCEELVQGGAPGVHLYTMNKPASSLQILACLRRKRPV